LVHCERLIRLSTLAASDKGVDGVLVANLNRPGANVTGICQLSRADDKTIAMLHELIAMLQRLALSRIRFG